MSLSLARALVGDTPPLPDGPPYACNALVDWLGVSFELPPGDPRLLELHDGGPAPTPPLDNLVGAVTYWREHPDWMQFLDPRSPSHHDKMVERALYLDFWADHLPSEGDRVLDLGGGVGRFMDWLLDRQCAVELVDPDLRSLWRAVTSAAGKPGALDVHWTTGERLPELAPLDCVIACEVLCYVEDPVRVLQNVARVLKPGAPLLFSVEARWGWAMGADVHEGSITDFFGDGIVHVPGDRWVRTFEKDDLADLLEVAGYELLALQPSHYALSGPFEMAAGELSVDEAMLLEDKLRAHVVSRGLNRAWMAVARPIR